MSRFGHLKPAKHRLHQDDINRGRKKTLVCELNYIHACSKLWPICVLSSSQALRSKFCTLSLLGTLEWHTFYVVSQLSFLSPPPYSVPLSHVRIACKTSHFLFPPKLQNTTGLYSSKKENCNDIV